MDWRRILKLLAFTAALSAMIWTSFVLPLPLPRPRPFQILLPLTAAGPVRLPSPSGPSRPRPLGPVYVRPTASASPVQQSLDLNHSAPGSSSEEDDDAADQPDYAYNHDDSAEERRRAQKYVQNLLTGADTSVDMKKLGRKDAVTAEGKGKYRRRQRKKKKVTTTTEATTTAQNDKPPPPIVIFAVTTQAGASTFTPWSTSTSTATIRPSTSKTKAPSPSKSTTAVVARRPTPTRKPEVENEVGDSLEQLLNDDLPPELDDSPGHGKRPSKGYRNPYVSYTSSDIDPQLEGASYADLVRIKHELLITEGYDKWSWWYYFMAPMRWFKSMLLHIFCRWQHQKHWSCAMDNDDWRRSFAGVVRRWSTN